MDETKIYEEIRKIHQAVKEIKAEQKQLTRLYNRIDAWITSIYQSLDELEGHTNKITKFIIAKEQRSLKARIKRLLRRG